MITKKKRRQYPVVYRNRQYRFLMLNLLYSVTICAIMFGFLFLPEIYHMQDSTTNPAMNAYAADRVLMLHSRLWLVVLAIIFLFALHSFCVFLTIIGPLKRFRDALEKLGQGDLTVRLFFRKRDYLDEEGGVFNRSAELLSDRIADARHSVMAIRQAMDKLKEAVAAIPEPSSYPVKKALDEMQSQLDQADQSAFFILSKPDGDSPKQQ